MSKKISKIVFHKTSPNIIYDTKKKWYSLNEWFYLKYFTNRKMNILNKLKKS